MGADRDDLGLVEIREYDEKNNNCNARMTFEKECALKIAEALLEYCDNPKNFKGRINSGCGSVR